MGASDWQDPHGVIPETFRDRFDDCETVAEALQKMQSEPTTTPDEEQDRCPRCGSPNISSKSRKREMQTRIETDYKCNRQGCLYHFDAPADQTTIPMTHKRTDAFDWTARDDLLDRDRRTSLDPPFAGVGRDTAVVLAIFLREPWRDEPDRRKYPEIARYLPYADSWVGHRVREWRDGEHRDLVPDPTADGEPVTVDEQGGATAVATDGGRRRRWAAYGSD